MKNRKTKGNEQGAVSRMPEESDEAREMRESIEEMERELAELDRDIAEAKTGEKGEMSRVALKNFQSMRKDIVEMIAGSRKLYKTVCKSDKLQRSSDLLCNVRGARH